VTCFAGEVYPFDVPEQNENWQIFSGRDQDSAARVANPSFFLQVMSPAIFVQFLGFFGLFSALCPARASFNL